MHIAKICSLPSDHLFLKVDHTFKQSQYKYSYCLIVFTSRDIGQ